MYLKTENYEMCYYKPEWVILNVKLLTVYFKNHCGNASIYNDLYMHYRV